MTLIVNASSSSHGSWEKIKVEKRTDSLKLTQAIVQCLSYDDKDKAIVKKRKCRFKSGFQNNNQRVLSAIPEYIKCNFQDNFPEFFSDETPDGSGTSSSTPSSSLRLETKKEKRTSSFKMPRVIQQRFSMDGKKRFCRHKRKKRKAETDYRDKKSNRGKRVLSSIPERSLCSFQKNNAKIPSDEVLNCIQLDKDEYVEIYNYYMSQKRIFEEQGKAVHLKKNKTGLPRTIIYIPDGSCKGLHIRTKVELGIGGINRVVRAFHVETGKTEAARSGLKKSISAKEIRANHEYVKADPEGHYSVAGYPVGHKGSFRPRVGFGECENHLARKRLKQKKNLRKVTMIMPEMQGGDLFDKIVFYLKNPNGCETLIPRIEIACLINQALIKSHENGLVDFDFKPENILLDEENRPKLSDFGFVFTVGDMIHQGIGSAGYVSPEMAKLIVGENNTLIVQTGNQMWQYGCVLALMFRGDVLERWLCQYRNEWENVINEQYLNDVISRCFPSSDHKGCIDWCISRCLKYYPEDRISALELQPYLDDILANAKKR